MGSYIDSCHIHLFTLAALLGASMDEVPNSWGGATIALVAIFLPSLFVNNGCTPFLGEIATSSINPSCTDGD